MKTITFKELIELIEQGKAPKEIRVSSIGYYYKKGNYYNIKGSELIQIPSEPLLTDEEKAYLKAVIEPVKENVFSIRRQSGTLYIHISVTATMTFNLKTFIYKFSGLKEEKSYNLSDLDLE